MINYFGGNKIMKLKTNFIHHLKVKTSHNEKIFCEAIYGSQNYNTATEKSDTDTYRIYIPTLKDALNLSKQPISNTHIMKNGEHIVEKDIRLFISELKKSSPNAIEILFATEWSTQFSEEWHQLRSWRDKLAYSNPLRTHKAMIGMATRLIKDIDKEEDRDKVIKKFISINRIHNFLIKFNQNLPYEKVLHFDGDVEKTLSLLPDFTIEQIKIAADVAYNMVTALPATAKQEDFDFSLLDNLCRDIIVKGDDNYGIY